MLLFYCFGKKYEQAILFVELTKHHKIGETCIDGLKSKSKIKKKVSDFK